MTQTGHWNTRPQIESGQDRYLQDACQNAAYELRRTCHARELRATPSKISWIPSSTPSSQTAVRFVVTGCRYFNGASMTNLSEHFWSDADHS
jgi:hypothetical protein